MTHRHFATLFDRNYLAKGIVLHASLMAQSSEPFTLHVLAMDSDTEKILNELVLLGVNVIALSTFERALNLDGVKAGRTWAEYCYTCGSNLMEYLLPWMDSDGATYLDADLMFFSDPKVIFDEIGERSIGITPHRFSPREQLRLGKNGNFNVGIVVARNTDTGQRCITRWAKQCREKCSALACGDQVYLNEWPELYGEECCVIQNLGVNLGPWSLDHLEINRHGDLISVSQEFIKNGINYTRGFTLNSFHFHEFCDEKFLTGYPLQQAHINLIYRPYISAWMDAKDRIAEVEAKLAERKLEAERQWETA